MHGVNVALKAMQEAAESDGRDYSATITALEQERDLVIRDFYGMREGPLPPDEPPGGALLGARIKPTPPARVWMQNRFRRKMTRRKYKEL
jgi:hypothetical protein